jgi:coenzyme F420 hydrogenase subunit gamma
MGLLSSVLRKNTGDTLSLRQDAAVRKYYELSHKEEKIVADKIEVGYVHMSGCTGCLVSFADNYEKLFTILDKYVELCSCLALIDARHMDTMDIAIVEGSVCIQDKLSVDEIKETREGGARSHWRVRVTATSRVSPGGSRTSQQLSFPPIGDLIMVDAYNPGCLEPRNRSGMPWWHTCC